MKHKHSDTILIKEERSDEHFIYTYELILREGKRTADWRLPLYSIRVSTIDAKGRKNQREATDVFTDKTRAERLFDMLVRNLATPIDLGYVVEDEVRI